MRLFQPADFYTPSDIFDADVLYPFNKALIYLFVFDISRII